MKKVVFILAVIAATMTSCDDTPSAYSDNGQLPYEVVTELSDSSNLATIYFLNEKTLYLKKGDSIYETKVVSESDLGCVTFGHIMLLAYAAFAVGIVVGLFIPNNK